MKMETRMNSKHLIKQQAPTLLLSLIIFFSSTPVSAQTSGEDDLQKEKITVVGSYRPEITESKQVPSQATLPEFIEDSAKNYDYNIQIDPIVLDWEAPAVRPVALGKEKLEPLDNVLARLGFGTQFSPVLDLAYSSGRSEKAMYGFTGNYISLNGQRENQLYSDARGQLFGEWFAGPVGIGFKAGARNEVVHFYGYNESDTSFESDLVRQRFLSTDAAIQFRNSIDNRLDLDFDIEAGVHTLGDAFQESEINPYLSAIFGYKLPSGDRLSLNTNYEFFKYSGAYDRNWSVIRFSPSYHFERKDWNFQAGVTLASDTGRFQFYPNLLFSRKLLDEGLIFFAGWDMRLQSNSWKRLTTENPFLDDSIAFINSRIENRYVGFRGEIAERFGYQFNVGQRLIDDQPYYVVSDTLPIKFDVIYDDLNLFTTHGEISYSQDNRYTIFLRADWHSFYKTFDQAEAWTLPNLSWSLGGQYSLNSKLNLTADIIGMSSSNALLADSSTVVLPGTVDINLGAEYKYNKYFTIWANIHNLASVRYERYFGYPSYGFRVVGGLQFSF